MIALRVRWHARIDQTRAWLDAGLIAAGLTLIVVARAAATRAGLDPLAIGAGFGGGLGLLAFVSGAARPSRRIIGATVLGIAIGLALVAAGLAGQAVGLATWVPGLARPAAPFLPWAVIIVGVAVAEEAILRGALFDRVLRIGGAPLAVLVTTIAFALLHVPLYGWHVVPLDLAVGLVLGGLRVATGGFAASAAAHAVADVATWWL